MEGIETGQICPEVEEICSLHLRNRMEGIEINGSDRHTGAGSPE